ncbi:MAG: sugar transferase [Desulfobacteraceae bacterium]|nr:MAG: sugar transferase [Desulfobacteraceae bacterium]
MTPLLKRLFDILLSIAALMAGIPVFVLIGLLIKREDDGSIFYRGLRIGRYGRPFKIFKFRTMVPDSEKRGGTSTPEDDPRITRIGKFLRKYKLDELPQLINVLNGEMSFVGPRPQVAWAVALYGEEEKRLLSVQPGITDYASIRFRNEAVLLRGSLDPDKDYLEKIAPEKLRLSLAYVNAMSLGTDLKIIYMTLKALCGRTIKMEV